MKKRILFNLLSVAVLMLSGLSSVFAATISWESAKDISSASDVLTDGTLIEAINARPLGTATVTVNGVVFQSSDEKLLNDTGGNTDFFTGTTGDAGYNELLSTLENGGPSPITIGGGNLVPGRLYVIQIWFTDDRNCCNGRVMIFGDGTNTVDVKASVFEQVESAGQFAVGSFTADATSQSLYLSTGGLFNSPHINAYQIRDVLGIEPGTVEIDIKPGSDPNCFNLNGHGVIPAAILGSEEFDVAQIDFSTLRFAGLKVRIRGNKGPLCHYEYVNGDGYLDMVCQFEDDPTFWSPGSGEADITGELLDGTEFKGTDSICVISKNKSKNRE